MFILAQILSFIAMVINMVAVQLKTKKQILLTIVISNLLFVISYILCWCIDMWNCCNRNNNKYNIRR